MSYLFGRRARSQARYVFALFQVFLEQGDDFLSSTKLRYLVEFLVLAAVVLSNAYKSNNVYTMISQRTPKSFELFSDLLQDNFTIHVSATRISFGKIWQHRHYKPEAVNLQYTRHLIQDLNGAIQVSSEIQVLRSADVNNSVLEMIQNNAGLHPGLRKIFTDLIIKGQQKWGKYLHTIVGICSNPLFSRRR